MIELLVQTTTTAPSWTVPALIFGGMYAGVEIAKKSIDALTHRKNGNGSALSKEEFSMLSANRSNLKAIRELMTEGTAVQKESLGILREIKTELQRRPNP